MSRGQKYVLAVGLLIMAIVLTYVPFQSTYNARGDNSKAYEGYSLLWSPPNPVKICIKTFGMGFESYLPLRQIIQKANRTCSVSPIFSRVAVSALATAFGTLAIFLLVGAVKKRSESLIPRSVSAAEPVLVSEGKQTDSLAQLLLTDLGKSFPVSSGNGKEGDPLIITALKDYVSVEYAVVRHVLGKVGEAYKLDSQKMISRNGRQIDELVFDVKSAGAADWTGRRRFYFDITKGFEKLG